jgi:hypothetical protein
MCAAVRQQGRSIGLSLPILLLLTLSVGRNRRAICTADPAAAFSRRIIRAACNCGCSGCTVRLAGADACCPRSAASAHLMRLVDPKRTAYCCRGSGRKCGDGRSGCCSSQRSCSVRLGCAVE